ncbi:MAG: hypothetical protein IT371_30385 [Deltaproteobacteria bacterium]|nr:hypothetical protein [Deltaproteobacteria bacterium]
MGCDCDCVRCVNCKNRERNYETIVDKPQGRPRRPRVSPSEHALRLVLGARLTDKQCFACRTSGPCKFGCFGDHDYQRVPHPERVTAAEARERLRKGRRVNKSTCAGCGRGDRCRVECPGDGRAVAQDRSEGLYLLTSRPLRTPVALRQWWEEAARRGLSVIFLDVESFDRDLADAQEQAEVEAAEAILERSRAAVDALRLKRGLAPTEAASSSSCLDTPVG